MTSTPRGYSEVALSTHPSMFLAIRKGKISHEPIVWTCPSFHWQDRFGTRRLADNVETRVVLTENSARSTRPFIESRDAQMPDLNIEGVAGRRRRTDSYPKHVDQADRRLDWREVNHARSQ
jgi:hypothetical protein